MHIATEHVVSIGAESGVVHGRLTTSRTDHGLVIVTRDVAYDQFDAALTRALNEAGISTLVLELLTGAERSEPGLSSCCRSDILAMARRVTAATDWLESATEPEGLSVGYFGTSMASAAVLMAAAQRPAVVAAVVVCDGRPLLAAPALPQVRAPTRSIVSTEHDALARVNRAGLARLLCEKRLECVRGAPQLMDDPSVREQLVQRARDWFAQYLGAFPS